MSPSLRGVAVNAILLLGLLAASHPATAGSIEYIHTDALGTPVAITDADRNVLQRSEYEPYGKLLNRPAEDGPGFTGHVTDQATGLSYMQQRYYDPGIGRFLSVDPVTASGNGGNFNRYLYAAGNPYRFTDPDGRRWKNPEFCNPCGSSGPVGAGGTGLGNEAAEFNFSKWAAAAPEKGAATDNAQGQIANSNLTQEQADRLAGRVRASMPEAKTEAGAKLDAYCAANGCDGTSSADLNAAHFTFSRRQFAPGQGIGSTSFTGAEVDRSTVPPTVYIFAGGVALGFGPNANGLANVLVHELRHLSPIGTKLHNESIGISDYGIKPSEQDAFSFQRQVMGDSYVGP
jgi:RHS repeat-associated protein